MLEKGNTLHFINRLDDTNCGDRVASPLLHYFDYFKQYRIKRHDMSTIDFASIAATDVVIIGGGGMLDYAEATNRNINRVLDTGAAVIAWAPGFNTHSEFVTPFQTRICYDKFIKIGVRDYSNKYNLAYMPDVTCKLSGLQEKYIIKRKYGIAQHKDYPITAYNFDVITNRCELDEILRFIGESEIIISNSFHMVYWAMLMEKKTLCADPFSDKFYTYKYKPLYLNTSVDDLEQCTARAPIIHNLLDECIQANDAFFAQVKQIIEARLEPKANETDIYRLVTSEALLSEKVASFQMNIGDLFASQLFIDVGNGFSETDKQLAINNVYGDDVHTVRYDLRSYNSINALRFDPIESRYCEVEILSAKSADGDIVLKPLAAVRVGNYDRFLSTDPQYFCDSPCAQFIEIEFKLRVLSLFEAEQNVYAYAEYTNTTIAQLSAQTAQLNAQLSAQSERVERQEALINTQHERMEWQTGQITRQEALIAQLNAQLGEQSERAERQEALVNAQHERMEWQEGQIERQEALLVKLNATLTQQTAQIEERDAMLQELRASTSWKITAPLRATAGIFKHK